MIEVINKIEKEMLELLYDEQMKRLHEILIKNLNCLPNYKEKNENCKSKLKLIILEVLF
ncbi:hypothetical protein [uncultured Clostridium sp.]|jgi:hypothetical protein|uniref:hypothetical protein n=1 Tax=uncultured Clostridium sp. TaxID=59620 RepID=UPI00260D8CA1|nr:hypothetical protein [uncultured Clostridium sp.]